MKRAVLLGAVLFGAVLSTGCITPEALKAARPQIDQEMFLSRPGVRDAMSVTLSAADALVPLGLFALGLSCYWKARSGASNFSTAARSYLWSSLATVIMLGAWNAGGIGGAGWTGTGLNRMDAVNVGIAGPDVVVRQSGRWLAERLEPRTEDFRWRGYFKKHEDIANALGALINLLGKGLSYPNPNPNPAKLTGDGATAIGYTILQPIGQYFIVANASAAYMMHVIILSFQGWLVAFYTIIGPLTLPFLLWERTRFVFFGWLKAYIALALWPALLSIAERINLSLIDVSYQIGATTTPEQAMNAVVSGSTAMFILNIVMVFGYVTVPVAAHMIVNGAGRPFRGVV